ncbi:MAG: nuclear transport factor 2 family protein [Novosphingobium sp.]|nr:nuclear transport factor 2 family protein [Novosphingobium sp.]
MNEHAARIEALELRWMRAWVNGDKKEMKALTSRDFIFLLGSTRPTILDRTSWLDAAPERLRCDSYRFGNIYVRRHGALAIFAAPVELEATLDDKPLFAGAFMTDLWKRSKLRRRWTLVERVLAPADADAGLTGAVRSMQRWR